ncbi:putative sugar kinase [Babesia sp. Xinjiang]|uniref:putative sugar kinase n=1 Tax=Babesia sp. Xinjiang TaxID=462227 RepID=UPI000A260DAB|nr:putative sugar kinase [Babesia sp. Xinjiang]ORM39800.1 putative sugar kinase [Babesia sp. Xinjiang]
MGDEILNKGPSSVLFVGHPMIDLFARVDQSVIDGFSVPKGESNIVPREEFERLSQLVKVEEITPGCSSSNTAFAYCYLGGDASYFGVLGDDDNGDLFDKHLSDNGVKVLTKRKSGHFTSQLLSLVTPDTERTMYLMRGASHAVSEDDISCDMLDNFDYYAVNGFMFATEEQVKITNKMVDAALSRGKGVITLLANSFCVRRNAVYLKPIVEKSAYIAGNIDEFLELSELQGRAELCKALAARTAGDNPLNKAFIVTMGVEGALIFYHGKEFFVPPTGANAIDSTGAGDFFAGAMLYGMLNGWSLKTTSQFTIAIVGDIISHVGTYMSPETREKVEHIKASSSTQHG